MSVFERSPNDPARAELNPFLKLALELGPLGVFFFANSRFGLFTATAVFMVATFAALTVSWLLTRKLAATGAIDALPAGRESAAEHRA